VDPARGGRAQGHLLHDARGRIRDLRGDRPPRGGRGKPAPGPSQGSSCMSRKPLTIKGAEKLRLDLRQLKTVERPRIIQAIAECRAHGDRSESAEYPAAREQQGFVEGRINDIEYVLSHCEIIDVGRLPSSTRVVFRPTVE